MANRLEVEAQTIDHIVFVSLSGVLDVASARAAQKELLVALAPELDVVVRLDRVERFDGAGLQILLSARTFVERRGHAFTLGALGTAAQRALESAGAASLFTITPASTEASA
jgi:anti-anti-sigma factor